MFDFIASASEFLAPGDIKFIPVHLNGLYLYAIEKILCNLSVKFEDQSSSILINLKELLYTIFAVGLLEFKSFGKDSVFEKTNFRYPTLTRADFNTVFDYIEPILFVKHGENLFTLFHSSFVDWFTDVKFSTRKYFQSLNQTHFLLAYYNYNKLVQLRLLGEENGDEEISKQKLKYWSKFRFHYFKSNNFMSEPTLNYMYLLFEYDYEYKVCLNTLDRKLLQCKKLLKLDRKEISKSEEASTVAVEEAVSTAATAAKAANTSTEKFKMFQYETSIYDLFKINQFSNDESLIQQKSALFDLIGKSDVNMVKHKLNSDFRLAELVRKGPTDAYNQTVLLVAVKANNFELVEYLLRLNASQVDHCDNSGWTALRYSAWIGIIYFISRKIFRVEIIIYSSSRK